jgi:hypothetical protein
MKVALVIVVGSIALLNVALMVMLRRSFEPSLAGLVEAMVGTTTLAVESVVKLQTKLAAMATPVRSATPVVIVAVSSVPPNRTEAGVKTAVSLAASYPIAPVTAVPLIVSDTVNAPGAEIVAGSMAWLKVAAIF